MSVAPHPLARERSLAMHRAIAERMRADPSVVARAKDRIAEWERLGAVAAPYIAAWRELLSLPQDELEARMLDPSEAAHDLRQVSPFAGVLDPRTRWQIHRAARSALEQRA